MNNKAQMLFDSLTSYQFAPVSQKKWSHVALFKEFARRMAWWADGIGIYDNWLTLNIAYVLELDETIDDKTPLQRLDAYLESQGLPPPMQDLLVSALMFAMVADHRQIKQFKMENPYDALVKLYSRGGYMRWNDRGFWEVSGAFGVGGMELATYKKPKPFVDLNDEELDLIDNGDKQSNMPDL